MKINLVRKFLGYVYGNYAGNFLGFVVGMASTRLVSHFFTTRSIRNLWGLTAHRTVVDKKTFSMMEWGVSIVIGFIVFELVSKWLQKKLDEFLPKYKATRWLAKGEAMPQRKEAVAAES